MTNTVHPPVLSFFPTTPVIKGPRPNQELAITAVEKAFRDGAKIVILEAPVGAGKTAIAMTLSRFYGQSHILTPRKSLQDQYYDDFGDLMALMKGRSSYPCIRWQPEAANAVLNQIDTGRIDPPSDSRNSCSMGPCTKSSKQKDICIEKIGKCPYTAAMEVAQRTPIICHNLHSFIFQANYGAAFDKRPLLAIDEAHDAASIVRGFVTKEIRLRTRVKDHEFPSSGDNVAEWQTFLLEDRFIPRNLEDKEEYLGRVESLGAYGLKYIVDVKEGDWGGQYVVFTPKSIQGLAQKLMLDFGERVLLMSGTIYSKAAFCRNLGIQEEGVVFLKMNSEFPAKMRPVYAKPEYMVDTSHRNWATNLPELASNIEKVLGVFKDVKGLIHVPSYRAADEILQAVKSDRLVTHASHNFQQVLKDFFESKGNGVLISPVCQQGVDFKGDRARFQILTRIPYLNTGDAFVAYKVENDFAWYNYQALIVLGQQLGRVNRAADDFGVTVLMDSRFPGFLQKNRGAIPQWVHDSIIYR